MTHLVVDRLSKTFGKVRALQDVSFSVENGEFFCIVGPTNAGKTTLLQTIAGLHKPSEGRIALGGRDIVDLRPADRHVSLLFQTIALFPTMTGFGNIAFPLKTAGVDPASTKERVEAVARMLAIDHILERHPRTFSGGEQQRVAIGRAIVDPKDLLMLDEPLSNLDARIRIALRLEFKRLHSESGQTFLYVTHDQIEAMSLSDRIAVLHEGQIQQIGAPDDIYHRPANRFVAEFIGTPPMNVLGATLVEEAGQAKLQGPGFDIPAPDLSALAERDRIARETSFAVRPEAIAVAPARSDETSVAGTVLWIEHLGSKSILDVKVGDHVLKVTTRPDPPVGEGEVAWLGLRPEPHHLLDPTTGRFFR